MNCPYTEDYLKEDVERTIGIRAKDIEKFSSAAYGISGFGLLGRTFIITVRIRMIRCIWLSLRGSSRKTEKNGGAEKLLHFFLDIT